MLATFAIAEDTPQAPGISIHDMFKLRQMWDDLQNNSKKDFSLNIRPNDICFKNHVREEEVCIHKAILAEMIFEAVKSGQTQMLADLEKILTKFKQTDLPEFNVGLKVNNPVTDFDENHRRIIDPNDRPGCNFTVATPTESLKAEINSKQITPDAVIITKTVHVNDCANVRAEVEFNPEKQKLVDIMLRMKNLEPKD